MRYPSIHASGRLLVCGLAVLSLVSLANARLLQADTVKETKGPIIRVFRINPERSPNPIHDLIMKRMEASGAVWQETAVLSGNVSNPYLGSPNVSMAWAKVVASGDLPEVVWENGGRLTAADKAKAGLVSVKLSFVYATYFNLYLCKNATGYAAARQIMLDFVNPEEALQQQQALKPTPIAPDSASQTHLRELFIKAAGSFVKGDVAGLAQLSSNQSEYQRQANHSQFNWPQFNLTQFNQSQFNWPQFNQSQFNWTQFNQSQFNQSQLNQSQFNQSQFNQSQFNQSQTSQSEHHWTDSNSSQTSQSEHHWTDSNSSQTSQSEHHWTDSNSSQTSQSEHHWGEDDYNLEDDNDYNQKLFNQSLSKQQPFNQSLFNQTLFNQQPFNQSLFNQLLSNQQPFNQSLFNQTLFNQSEFDPPPPPFHQSLFNQTLFNQTQFNQTLFNQTQFNQSFFNQSRTWTDFNQSQFNNWRLDDTPPVKGCPVPSGYTFYQGQDSAGNDAITPCPALGSKTLQDLAQACSADTTCKAFNTHIAADGKEVHTCNKNKLSKSFTPQEFSSDLQPCVGLYVKDVAEAIPLSVWGNSRFAVVTGLVRSADDDSINVTKPISFWVRDDKATGGAPAPSWKLLAMTTDPVNALYDGPSKLATWLANNLAPETEAAVGNGTAASRPSLERADPNARFADWVWEQPVTQQPFGQVVEFNYGFESRLFFLGSQVRSLSEGQLMHTGKLATLRVWTLYKDGSLAIGEGISFPY